MRFLLLRWLIAAIAIGLTAWLMPGVEIAGGILSLFFIALIFGLVNAIVRPIITLLTCPFIILTMGLFLLIINTLMFQLTAWLTPALSVTGFWAAFWASLVISIISAGLNSLVHNDKEKK